MQEVERQQAALIHIETVGSDPDRPIEETWRVLTETLAEALSAARVSVWFLDDEEVTLRCVDLYLLEDDRHESGHELRAGEFPRYFAALTAERAIDAHEAATDPRTSEFAEGYLAELGISSMLDAPIRKGGRVVGVICIEHQGEPRRWRLDEVLCGGAAGDQLAKILIMHERQQVASELALREEQLRQMHKMEAIGQLAGGIAHDFNNMLAGIMGSTSILERSVAGDNKRARRAIDLIQRSSERARDLVTKLLTFSRKSKELSTTFDVHSILDDTLTLFQRGGQGNIKVVRNFHAEVSRIHGDPTDMQSALLNICINAGDAMPAGGILKASTQLIHHDDLPPHLPRLAAVTEEYLMVAITDTGSGIRPELLERVFEPFFTTKDHGKGTGLGLAAVYAIVSHHEGMIDLDSTYGKGTTFRVYLPLQQEVDGSLSAGVGKSSSDENLRVLVVDDEQVVRAVAGLLLEEMGHEVTLVAGGKEALELIREDPKGFDLVLLDMSMPSMSGEQCFERLRSLAPELSVMVSTGFAHSTAIDRMLREGVKGVIHKPYTFKQLSDAVLLAVSESRGQ